MERANALPDPLAALGKALEEVMEVDSFGSITAEGIDVLRARIAEALTKHGLEYHKGGAVRRREAGLPHRTLDQLVRSRNLSTVSSEFERIQRNIDLDPPAAVTASCALLEALFRVYIEDEELESPSDQSIKPLWNVVRKHLGLDPAGVTDEDLRKVLSGLGSIVDGIASARTHHGSAHGQRRGGYRPKPRHARLVVHAAATLATFILETWEEKGRRK